MKSNIFLFFLLLAVNVNSKGQNTPAPEQAKAQDVISGLFAGLAELNVEKVRSCCSPEVKILESGKVWTIDSLLLRVTNRKAQSPDFKRINKLDFLETKVDGYFAYLFYFNQATITASGKTVTIKWLESAVLKKENSKWKINLLHSTEMERGN